MSRTAPFKPEWIAELRVVGDDDPENPDVAYNNGHLMHQTTFFIGPVNFYWRSGGRNHCVEMTTGDSNYITPYVPHSFTSRRSDRRGLIIAVTYAGQVGRALRGFMEIGAQAAERAAGDLRTDAPFERRLVKQLEAESLSTGQLIARLISRGIGEDRAAAIIEGHAEPAIDELRCVAEALSVRPSDLSASRMTVDDEVIIRRRDAAPARNFPADNDPAYRLTELARSRHQPFLKGFDMTVLGGARGDFCHGLHEYAFNYGSEPVELVWDDGRSATVPPDGSAYIRPFVRHRFERPDGCKPGRVVMIRVPGQLTDPVLDEYAAFATEGRGRAAGETRRWF